MLTYYVSAVRKAEIGLVLEKSREKEGLFARSVYGGSGTVCSDE